MSNPKKGPEHHFTKANLFCHDTTPEDIAALHATLEGGESGVQTFGTAGTIGGGQDNNHDLGEDEQRVIGGMSDSQRLKAQIKARKVAKKAEEKEAKKEKAKRKTPTPAKKMRGPEKSHDTVTQRKRKRELNKTKKNKVPVSEERVHSDDDENETEEPKKKRKYSSKAKNTKNSSRAISGLKSAVDDEEPYQTAEPKPKRAYTKKSAIKPTPDPKPKRKPTSKRSKQVDSDNDTTPKRRYTRKSPSISKPPIPSNKKEFIRTAQLAEQNIMQDHFKRAMESPWKDAGEGSSSMGMHGRISSPSNGAAAESSAEAENDGDGDDKDDEKGSEKPRKKKNGANRRHSGIASGGMSFMTGSRTMDDEDIEDIFNTAGFCI